VSAPGSPYRLDDLGWLQFERLCSLVLEADAGLTDLAWLGRADRGRISLVEERVAITGMQPLAGPVSVVVAWSPANWPLAARVSDLVRRVAAVSSDLGSWCTDQVLVLTNLDGPKAEQALGHDPFAEDRTVAVLGSAELCAALDRHAGLRRAMPSVLGLRDLSPLIADGVRARSSLDVERAQALAGVFWPTRAYERARAVLAEHRFVVLTGPPEMGKTAIAEMLALAQLTDGWEAHECNSPDQLWRVFEPKDRQVFIADDAFGSTEYRPDAAERWARALGRLLAVLDESHWLIWTSRPAPLKAGLRRVQREHGSERFPAPGEVLVDAGDLDLAEKTLILFRHTKARQASRAARHLLRTAGLAIVEHPHFTPERIRRLVTDRIEALPELIGNDSWRAEVERELTSPSEAMRISFGALEDEHRGLLIALLDAPAGLIAERDLTATVRRHYAGGLSRAPHELIDRLTDHFLRVTPQGIGWVHPSWRDLVINELREDAAARHRFLGACEVHGTMLALSQEGGSGGERSLPLLVTDGDWDLLGDRLGRLAHQLGHPDLARLLLALGNALGSGLERARKREAHSLAGHFLRVSARRCDQERQPLPVYLVDAWYALNDRVWDPALPPRLGLTWAELHPGSLLLEELERSELTRADDWLALAQTLARYDTDTLAAFGFFARDHRVLEQLIAAIDQGPDPEMRPLAESALTRIADLAPDLVRRVEPALTIVRREGASERRWWIPEDITAPPTTEAVSTGPSDFRREDVARVLNDL
jgi:conflict system STAND superfamily ATPase